MSTIKGQPFSFPVGGPGVSRTPGPGRREITCRRERHKERGNRAVAPLDLASRLRSIDTLSPAAGLAQGGIEGILVGQVGLDEAGLRMDEMAMAPAEVIDDGDLMALLEKNPGDVRANEPRTTGHQDVQAIPRIA